LTSSTQGLLIQIDDVSPDQFDSSKYQAQAHIYSSDGKYLGTFEFTSIPDDPKNKNTLAEGAHPYHNMDPLHGESAEEKPHLSVGVADKRGIRIAPGINPEGKPTTMEGVAVHGGNFQPWTVSQKGRDFEGCPGYPNTPANKENFPKLTGSDKTGSASGIIWINRNNACNLPPKPEQILQSIIDNYANK